MYQLPQPNAPTTNSQMCQHHSRECRACVCLHYFIHEHTVVHFCTSHTTWCCSLSPTVHSYAGGSAAICEIYMCRLKHTTHATRSLRNSNAHVREQWYNGAINIIPHIIHVRAVMKCAINNDYLNISSNIITNAYHFSQTTSHACVKKNCDKHSDVAWLVIFIIALLHTCAACLQSEYNNCSTNKMRVAARVSV